ncbi:hypothetical protein F4604DRAFT_1687834 [Suillus subluteus]|nr:hypothetical protein F4604DRAFT_1687834 [Suillus subluteus]
MEIGGHEQDMGRFDTDGTERSAEDDTDNPGSLHLSRAVSLSNELEVEPPTSMSFASELQELKNKLNCEKHGKFCYINPISGDHEAQDIYNLTLWVKKIFLAEATYEKPPEMAAFDHIPKKRWLSSANTSSASVAPTLPAIHVHIAPVTKEVLSDTGGCHRVNTSRGFATTFLCHDEDDEFITFPPLPTFFVKWTSQCHSYICPNMRTPFSIMASHIMSMGVIWSFLKVTHQLIRYARKGKGRAANNKNDKENHDQCCRDQSVEI